MKCTDTCVTSNVVNGSASTAPAEVCMVSADGLEPSTHALKGPEEPKLNDLD
jgi:hypothetical protein